MKRQTLLIFTITIFIAIGILIFSMSFFGAEGFKWFEGFYSNDIKAKDSIRISSLSLILVGIGLSLSGVAMQGVVRNKLASSYSMGTIATSMLAMILVNYVFRFNNEYINAFFMIIFSLFISLLIMLITFSGKVNSSKIIVVGLVMSIFISSITYILRTKYNLTNELISFLSVDTFNGTWFKFYVAMPMIILGSIPLLLLSKKINIHYVDPQKATALGIEQKRLKIVVSISSVLIAASSVYLMGPIAFIGILVPQLARSILKNNANTTKVMLFSVPLSIIILLLAEIMTRALFSHGFTINVIITVIAGPIVIYKIVRGGYE